MNKNPGRTFILVVAGALLFLATSAAGAAEQQCRDANGRFMKCPPAPPAPTRCRDITTKKFVKCGSPHSEAVPAPSGK
jgi:hypothetical protein